MDLYHANRRLLSPGDVIEPGNYGRIIAATLKNHGTHPFWEREQILEQVRAAEFAHKPSRLSAAYACIDLDIARHYRRRECPEGYLYEVEVVDPNEPTHLGDFNAVQHLPGSTLSWIDVARRYWLRSDRTNVSEWGPKYCDEFLTASPIRVIRVVAND